MRTFLYMHVGDFLGGLVAKNPPANAGAAGDVSFSYVIEIVVEFFPGVLAK